jgi:hypothetical protein
MSKRLLIRTNYQQNKENNDSSFDESEEDEPIVLQPSQDPRFALNREEVSRNHRET